MPLTEDQLWRRAVLRQSATIKSAIHNLDELGLQIVLVVDEANRLIGTVSDGDVRRGLLKGLQLDCAIEELLFHNPVVVPPELEADAVKKLMIANRIRQVPIVDENNCVTGLHLWDDLNEPPTRPNLFVIMAGGMGMRLRPHTENCPKPMLSVAGKPMLEHIIDKARIYGFRHFAISVNYKGEMIEDYFGNGDRFGVVIDYVRESSPLGTAGSLSLLSPRPQAPFVVTNGEIISDIHYGALLDFHMRHHAAATMAVRVQEWENPFGVVKTEGVDIVDFLEKPVSRSHINAGVYVLEPAVLDDLEKDTVCDMPVIFGWLRKANKRTVAYAIHEPWLDVGRLDDLDKINRRSTKP